MSNNGKRTAGRGQLTFNISMVIRGQWKSALTARIAVGYA